MPRPPRPPPSPTPPRRPTARAEAGSRGALPGEPCVPTPPALGRHGSSTQRGDLLAPTFTCTRPGGSPLPTVRQDGRHSRRQTCQRIQRVPQEIEVGTTLHEYLVTGRNGQPFVFQVPAGQVGHHRAISADHLYLVQSAQFPLPAPLRDRLRPARPLRPPTDARPRSL